jgi:hypothetical protein
LKAWNSTISLQVTDATLPPTATIYLPMLNKTDVIKVNATLNTQPICIELFRGVIQPKESTQWWLNHELAARSPKSIEVGEINPSLSWQVNQSGLYTIVIVLRGYYVENSTVTVDISCFTSNGGTLVG